MEPVNDDPYRVSVSLGNYRYIAILGTEEVKNGDVYQALGKALGYFLRNLAEES